MTTLDDAGEVLAEYRATPPASTRRRVRLALVMKDIEEEYADRLLDGARKIIGEEEPDRNLVSWWQLMDQLRSEIVTELDNLGIDRTQMAIAFATTIFDAEVIESK